MAEHVEVLAGGVGNAGAVLRVGDEVQRPAGRNVGDIHALLRHLEHGVFDGVPRVRGLALDGTERLGYIAGDVPIPPFPAWSQTDAVLASTASLLRRYHDAVLDFARPPGASWSNEMADPQPGASPVLCHNDVCPENVVYRDGSAVALLDFEFAAPGRRVWDVAAMTRMCVPIETDEDAARTGRSGLDPFARLRVAADAYGLGQDERAELLDVLAGQIERGGEFVRRRIAAGEQAFIDMWHAMGGQARHERRHAWFTLERDRFAASLGC